MPAVSSRGPSRRTMASSSLGLLSAAVVSHALLGHGCRDAVPVAEPAAPDGRPSLRLVLFGNLAGALEPCGCTKEQLGGLDHLGALLERERQEAHGTVLLGAGALLFSTAPSDPDSVGQQRWKAEAIAASFGELGLSAWAPGGPDWSDGPGELGRYAATARAKPLASNLGRSPLGAGTVIEAGGVKVGIVGLSDPRLADGRYPEGFDRRPEGELEASLASEIERLEQQGARLFVGLAAMPRGPALRLVEHRPELHVLAVAEPSGAGEADDDQPAAVLVGPTLVVQAANHLQTVVLVDVYLHGVEADSGPMVLSDTGGIAQAEHIASLSRRIRQLEIRIADWLKGGRVPPEELAARRADLDKLRRERAQLEQQTAPPAEANGVRTSVREIRDSLGSEPRVAARMRAYYRRVNEHNRVAFADRKPLPARAGEASYVGQDACSTPDCHQAARKFCDTTPHTRAYESLVKELKEYNLECVSCHVTGYGQRGGSTVTFNQALRGVQCEECHGPGSLHVARPNDKGLVVLKTPPELCSERCHRPPHVVGFDPGTKMELELGPGHGAR